MRWLLTEADPVLLFQVCNLLLQQVLLGARGAPGPAGFLDLSVLFVVLVHKPALMSVFDGANREFMDGLVDEFLYGGQLKRTRSLFLDSLLEVMGTVNWRTSAFIRSILAA